ncbi:MAG: homoserine dehydrogenase [Pseudomonadota bacterium]
MTDKTLKLGVAGLGNVGSGLVQLVQRQDSLRIPGRLEIACVSARNRSRDRGVDISNYAWFDDPSDLAASDDIDVFVELVGGSDGPAKKSVEIALESGKSVVTANKALIAEHGLELAARAERSDAHLLFEAAVAGGVPIVRAIRDSLAGVEVERVSGILNGTCNYILTEMLTSGAAYTDVLADAQRLGYAEADPYLDVSGMDAAHKIVILAAMAFKAKPDFSKVSVAGVDQIDALDISLADRLGYRVRLIAEAKFANGGVSCGVSPVLFPVNHPLAQVGGPLNAVLVDGDPVGRLTFTGPGAGAGPTASAVLGDIARLFHGPATAPFGVAASTLVDRFIASSDGGAPSAYFIRARLTDKSGAMAALSDALASSGVSIDTLHQDSGGESGAAPIALVTHPCSRTEAEAAVKKAKALDASVDAPQLIRIEA